MITLSFSSDKGAKNANRGTREKEIRDIVDTHLAFPGSEKLKMGVNVKDNGAFSVSFTGPQEVIAEAKRLWRENVKPAAAKVKKAALKAKRAATRAAKPAKRKTTKKAETRKAAVNPVTAKKATKRIVARTKAKVSRKAPKKRKA
jgi:hypothetical protein